MPVLRDDEIERLLAEELGQVAKSGVKLTGTPFAGWGAALGGKLGAKLSRTDRHEQTLSLPVDAKDLLLALYAWFAKNGRLVREADASLRLVGVTKAGFMDMNPVVVVAELRPAEGTCTLLLTGYAKEGLIPQHTAAKGVAKVAEALHAEK